MTFKAIHSALVGLVGLAAVAAVFVALPAGAGAAKSGADRPFKFEGAGVHTIGFDGIAARCPAGTIFRTFIEATGQATHVGSFGVTGDHCTFADLSYGGGRWTLTAADGDTINAPYEPAPVQPENPDFPSTIITDVAHTVTGGTGRFADATGSFVCRVTLSNIDWGTFTADLDASCEGTISY